MKIDFNKNITNLDGSPVLEGKNILNMGKVLSNYLVLSRDGQAIKMYDWAIKIFNGQNIEIDEADKNYLKQFIENHRDIAILVKAQLLKQLEVKVEEKGGEK